MAAHLSSGRVSSFTTAPRAQGAKMSHATAWALAGSTVSAPNSLTALATLSTSTSATVRRAPAACSREHRWVPTLPTPWTTTWRAASSWRVHSSSATAPRPRRHPLRAPVGGVDRGAAAAAVGRRAAGDEPGLLGEHVHVGDVGPDVLGGDVAAAEALDEAAVGAQQGLGLDALGVADDDRLAPAEVEPGHGRLVAHAPGQPEDVGQGVVLRGVGIEAGATERRAEGGRMDGDDGLQAGGRVVVVDDLFVLATHEPESSHG